MPGIVTIQGSCANNHASEICAGVASFAPGPFVYDRDKGQIPRTIFGCEPRHHGAEVAPLKLCVLIDGTGQKPHRERAPADETDAQFLADRKDLRTLDRAP